MGPDEPSESSAGSLPRWSAPSTNRLMELLETGAADLTLVFRILERFGKRADDAATEMATAVLDDDRGEVSRLAHGFRGAAANYLTTLSRSSMRAPRAPA